MNRMEEEADALGAYQDARGYLRDELGVDPGPELRELHQAILRHDAAIPAPRSARQPGGTVRLGVADDDADADGDDRSEDEPGRVELWPLVSAPEAEIDTTNRIITDIAKAPRNARGKVEYSASFAVARPVDPAKASGVLYYEVPNRGYVAPLEADEDGHFRVVSGWQGDIPPMPGFQTATVPVAAAPGGASLTGPVLVRFVNAGLRMRS